jgi:hypothetical protein
MKRKSSIAFVDRRSGSSLLVEEFFELVVDGELFFFAALLLEAEQKPLSHHDPYKGRSSSSANSSPTWP